jgi:hypothetical protein
MCTTSTPHQSADDSERAFIATIDDGSSIIIPPRCEVCLVKLERKLKSQEGILDCLNSTLEAASATQLAKICEDQNTLKEQGFAWQEVNLFDEDEDSSVPTKIAAKEEKKLLTAYQPGKEAVASIQRRHKRVVARCA